MDLKDRLSDDRGAALKRRDSVRAGCLRMLKAGVKYLEIEKGRELGPSEIRSVASSMIKKGKEAGRKGRRKRGERDGETPAESLAGRSFPLRVEE